MKPADWLFFFCLAFIGGVFLKSFWDTPWLFFLNLAFVSLAAFVLSFFVFHKPVKIFLPISLVFLTAGLGILRTDFKISAPDQLQAYRDNEEIVEIAGKIKGQPSLRDNHIKYTVLTDTFSEKILINAELTEKFNPGDKILIRGKLQTPAEFPDFNYREFLQKDGIQTVAYYPEIEILKEKKWSFLGLVLKAKNKLREANRKIIPFPQGEILAAMTLGDAPLMPQTVKDNFNKVGIRHITAISGMHIGIIAGLLAGILYASPLKNKTFWIVSIFLIFYVTLVGWPASAVRAAIMGSILLLAEKVRRKYFAERALVLAAFVMLLLNPLLLRLDVGFQLSFLAVLGIITTAPFFAQILKRFIRFKYLTQIVAITLAAQVFTLPILIYNFGIFSTVSPLANVLVVPLVPFIIVGGFLAMIGGAIHEWLGLVLAFPVYLILKYITWLSEFAADSPWSFQTISGLHVFWMILYYLILLPFAFWLKRKLPQAELNLLPKTNKNENKNTDRN